MIHLVAEHGDKVSTGDGPAKIIIAVIIIMALWGTTEKKGKK